MSQRCTRGSRCTLRVTASVLRSTFRSTTRAYRGSEEAADNRRARFIVNKHGASSPVEIPRFVSTFICGSGAGILSWVVIYPLDLAKANLQRNALALAPYESPWHIFRRLADGGVTKLYRGLGVSAIRSIASHGLMWTVLEAVRGHIEHDTGMVGRD